MTDHKPMPVYGYTSQIDENLQMVNINKRDEEMLLRSLDAYAMNSEVDRRWLSIAKTHFEQGFMALNRSIFKPQRIKFPEDE